MGEFANQVIVITGGGSGIGKACALLFGREKAAVVVLDWDEEAGQDTVKQIEGDGGLALGLKVDVGNSAQVIAAIARILDRFGKIDILFANAAVQVIKPIEQTTDEDWERVIGSNLRGTFVCCREVVRVMRRQRSGCIIITSSGHALQSYTGYTAYAASKGGQLAFMRALALDCASDGIRVNCIIPGATETQLIRDHFANQPDEEARLLSKIPMHRLASPDDIAHAVRMLASRNAAYITGTTLVVDGGLLAQG